VARFSTGLRNALASNYGLGAVMNGGVLYVYGNTAPRSPDEPPGAVEIGRITTQGLAFIPGTDNGAGIKLELVTPGALVNAGSLRLRGIGEGQAHWWRWCWAKPDPMILSTYYPRVDGEIPGELRLLTVSITPTTDVMVEQFLVGLPMGV